MAADKNAGQKMICVNRKASFNYHLEKKYEAGIALKGSEVKSCRDAKVQLVDSYASIEKGEIFLYKAHISEYKQGGPFFNHEPARKRKLLLHKEEIQKIQAALNEKGFTLVPTKMYFKKGRAKVELALAKGKNKGDKRQSLKEKDVKRDMDKARKYSR